MAAKFQRSQPRLKITNKVLNLENAVFERETDYAVTGENPKIRSTRFLSADKPNLGVIKYGLTMR